MDDALADEVRQIVQQVCPGRNVHWVWTNPLGGRTYRLTDAEQQSAAYLKVADASLPASHLPADEAVRVRWIGDRLPVPPLLDHGVSDGLSWMLTDSLPGRPASELGGVADPEQLARMLGRSIRAFHDHLASGVDDCPWSWSIDHRLTHGTGSAEARLMVAHGAPDEDDLVVAHGDICAPNILVHGNLSLAGFTDLGTVGVAARAADLGCHQWSLEFNDMADQVGTFLDAYGFAGDPTEVQWYRDFFAVV